MKNTVKNCSKAVIDTLKERKRQDELWGEQNHDPFVWLSILMEEVGEFSEDMLTYKFDNNNRNIIAAAREEMVQVAAVAIAIIESLDRNELNKKSGWETSPKPTLKTRFTDSLTSRDEAGNSYSITEVDDPINPKYTFRFWRDKDKSFYDRTIEARTLADAWKQAHDIESADPKVMGVSLVNNFPEMSKEQYEEYEEEFSFMKNLRPTNTHTNADNRKSNNTEVRPEYVAKSPESNSGDSSREQNDCGCGSSHGADDIPSPDDN